MKCTLPTRGKMQTEDCKPRVNYRVNVLVFFLQICRIFKREKANCKHLFTFLEPANNVLSLIYCNFWIDIFAQINYM